MKNLIVLFAAAIMLSGCSGQRKAEKELAMEILADSSLEIVDSMARALLKKGFNAGSGYSQVWARDLNTFIEIALDEVDHAEVRGALLVFFALQQPNNEMIDGYVVKSDFTWGDPNVYLSETDTSHVGFKNTVETDQETSLIQTMAKYIRVTGDKSILSETVGGKTVLERMKLMKDYLMKERYNAEYGLLWGAMTADWGDVQPNTDNVVDIDSTTTPAIDVYDNAMFIIALRDMAEMDPSGAAEWNRLADEFAERTMKHLWDEENDKFIPHIYIDRSPIPEGFDESKVFYHGGTAIAIEAGLLDRQQVEISNNKMLENVRLSGAPSIGLTLYPVYPDKFFHGGMGNPYVYQNGGDWTWFGARMIQQLIRNAFVREAYDEVRPMIDRVITNRGFYEWYQLDGKPNGSGDFKGSAGTLALAIKMFREWANEKK
jgi:hypothetical protein